MKDDETFLCCQMLIIWGNFSCTSISRYLNKYISVKNGVNQFKRIQNAKKIVIYLIHNLKSSRITILVIDYAKYVKDYTIINSKLSFLTIIIIETTKNKHHFISLILF